MNKKGFSEVVPACGRKLLAARLVPVAAVFAAAMSLTSCQSAGEPSFPANPTDSGSRYSDFNLPGSNMGMQNTDLED